MAILGYILIAIGIVFIYVGFIGVFRFRNFYARILSAADVDTVGFLTILIGACFVSGFNISTLKILLVIVIVIIINPIVTSAIAKSAFLSGYKHKDDKEAKND